MKLSFRVINTAIISSTALIAFTTSTLHAEEYPSRKAGLWEMTTSINMRGRKLEQKATQCIDAETDRLMLEGPTSDQSPIQCDKPVFTKKGTEFHSETVCQGNGMKVITTAVFSGDFSSEYTGDLVTRQDPPMEGFPEQKIKILAKWLGPCKEDQEPGDMILSDGTKLNILVETKGNMNTQNADTMKADSK